MSRITFETNAERKHNLSKAMEKIERIRNPVDAKNAFIDACNEQKRLRDEQLAELRQKLENLRLQRLYNLKKRMVIVFVKLDDILVILTIIDPSLIKCPSTTGKNHHIVYGDTEYKILSMMASHNPSGTRIENKCFKSYTVSTLDRSEFEVIDKNGKPVFSFETFMKYESLTGKTFSDVVFDQFLFSPSNVESDEKTAMFHTELLRLIKEDADYLKENPDIVGYIPYHWSNFK